MAKDKRTYDVLIEVWNKAEPYLKYAMPNFKLGPCMECFLARHDPWRVAPDDKKQKTHVLAGSRQSEIAVFPHAIAIGSPAGNGKAEGGKLALMAVVPAFVLLYVSIAMFSWGMVFVSIFGIVFFILFSMAIAWALKKWLCAPTDWPIIFNRKDRTVAYTPTASPPFWKFWSTEVKQQWLTAGWDESYVRSYKYRQSNAGMTFHDSYNVNILWGGKGDDPKSFAHGVSIGYQGYFEDELIWMLWEHIRRYMEEDGPAIPHGESLRPLGKGKPIVYPPEVIAACGGPPLSEAEVAAIAAAAPAD